MNNVPDAWPSAVALGKAGFLPRLEELHLCQNQITDFGPGEDAITCFPALKLLNFDQNELCDWRVVQRLQQLPRLERLILNNNDIGSVSYHSESCSNPFDKLTALSLNNNKLNHFDVMTELNLFPKVTELRLQGNPMWQDPDAGAVRLFVVARLPKLTMLNISPVPARERLVAEKAWLKYCFARMPAEAVNRKTAGVEDEDTRGVLHLPRYLQLVEEHGHPNTWGGQNTKGDGATLNDRLLELTLSKAGSDSSVVKSLPPTMKISTLKVLLKKIFKVRKRDVRISYQLNQADMEILLDNDLNTLADYQCKSNGLIVITA